MVYLQNSEKGLRAGVCETGASLVVLEVPLADGSRRDVVLGYEDTETYFCNEVYLGVTVAPCANRIGGASFSLNGVTCYLDKNDGENCLHGGFRSLQDRNWDVTEVSENAVTFSAETADGENGFPGPLHVDVTYTVQDRDLVIDYRGSARHAEKDLLFNPTNHSYFNLNGQGIGDVLNHRLTVFADRITPAGPGGVPDGRLLDVNGTPFDFRKEKSIGERIDADEPLLTQTKGYDHNYILCKTEELRRPEYDVHERKLYLAARLTDAQGLIGMEVITDMPGMQLYTANYLNVQGMGKNGSDYPARSAVCLETQYFPNAVNVPAFPQPVIRAGEEVYSRTVYRFPERMP